MDLFWEFYQQELIREADRKSGQAVRGVERVEDRIARLERTVEQLKLINVAFAELLTEKFGVAESELIAKVQEIDLRDGVQDGKASTAPALCPKCGRHCNARKNRCLYCGFSDDSNDTILDRIT
jgi:hypothetical protein